MTRALKNRRIKAFDVAGKPIATLCHGPWVLASAALLAGRTRAPHRRSGTSDPPRW